MTASRPPCNRGRKRIARAAARALMVGALLVIALYGWSCAPRSGQTAAMKQGAAPVDYAAIPPSIEAMLPAIHRHVAALAAAGSRQTGQAGCDRAYEYIRTTLAELRPDLKLKEFSSPVTVPLDRTAGEQMDRADEPFSHVVVEGLAGVERWPAYAFFPNCAQPCVTHAPGACPWRPGTTPGGASASGTQATETSPANGSGDYCPNCEVPRRVVDLGDGSWAALEGKDPNGAIVLLDFNSGDAWLRAAQLGAVGALFLAPEATTVFQADRKYLATLPLNFPRMYLRKEDGQRLRAALKPPASPIRVTLKNRLRFVNVPARGLELTIPGKNREYCFVLAGHYDARCIVPDWSYGAAETWGIAELLELARYFAQHPPACDIQVIFTAGNWQTQRPMREYVFADKFAQAGQYYRLAMAIDLDPEGWGVNLMTESWWDADSQTMLGWLGRALFNRGGWREEIFAALHLDPRQIELFGGTRPTTSETVEDSMADRNNRSPMVYAPRYHTAEEPWQAIGMPAFAFQTGRLARLAQNTPLDRFAESPAAPSPAIDDHLRPQLQVTLAVLHHLLNYPPELLPTIPPNRSKRRTWGGYAQISGHIMEWDRSIGWFAAHLPGAAGEPGKDKPTPPASSAPAPPSADSDGSLSPRERAGVRASPPAPPPPERLQTFVHAYPTNSWATDRVAKRLRNFVPWPLIPDRAQHRELQSFMFQDLVLLDAADFRLPMIYADEYNVAAYSFDASGRLRYAPDYGIHGDGNPAFRSTNLPIDYWDKNVPLSLFECGTVELLGLVDPQRYDPTKEVYGSWFQSYDSNAVDRGVWPYLRVAGVKDVTSHTDLERFGYAQFGPTAMVFLPPQSLGGSEILLGSYFTNFAVVNSAPGRAPGAATQPASQSGGGGHSGGGFSLVPGQTVRLGGGAGVTPRACVEQLADLDEHRLAEFARHDVASPLAKRYTAQSAAALAAGREAQEQGHWHQALGQYLRAWTFQSQAYRHTVALLLDVVSTTVLYFVLLVPFSLLLERLVFPQRTVPRTALVALLVFLVFAAILYNFHPGFKLAHNVVVTTTAFAIVVMTIPALVLLLVRGVAMLRAIGSHAVITQQSEAEAAGVVTAALSLAVSNMRRRKLRTGLTLATITLLVVALVLLTTSAAFDFQIMQPSGATSASFQGLQILNARDHRQPLLKEMVDEYEGVLARGTLTGEKTRNWRAAARTRRARRQPPPLVIRRECVNYGYDHKSANGSMYLHATNLGAGAERRTAVPYFQVMDWRDNLVEYTLREDIRKPAAGRVTSSSKAAPAAPVAPGAPGVAGRRTLHLSDLMQGQFLAPDDVDVCLIPNNMAEDLGVTVGDTVTFLGLPLRVKGIWAARQKQPGSDTIIPGPMDRLVDLDGTRLTAMDGAKSREGEPAAPIHCASSQMVIVPRAWVARYELFPTCVYSLLVIPGGPAGAARADFAEQLSDLGGRLAGEILNVDVFTHFVDAAGVSHAQQTNMYTATHVQGSSLMLVVLVAAVLMILSIMIGTVYERMREIHILSSVGLSPRHVAGMFLVEALVYAGVAAVLGYFIGIIALKGLLAYLKSTGATQEFYPNYLGVFVLYSTGVAAAATVASSLYPIRLASRIVNPSAGQPWAFEPLDERGEPIAPPAGSPGAPADSSPPDLDAYDYLLVRLPFIATTDDEARAMMVYAGDWLAIHQGERSGQFVCERPPAGASGPRSIRLAVPTWLAPFERNLMQEVELVTQPTADGLWWEMSLRLRKISGPPYLWRRGATVFVNRLCKHLLHWRAATATQETDCLARFAASFPMSPQSPPQPSTQPPPEVP